MGGTDTWVRVEQRTAKIAEFRSVQSVDVGETRAVRLLFHTDFADQFPVFVLSSTRPSNDLRTGDLYFLDGVVLCRIESPDQHDQTGPEASGVGEHLPSETVQTIGCAALQVGVEGTFGYVDRDTDIAPLGSERT